MELLVVKGISKKYKEKIALNEVSIKISSGEIVALIGGNGAGKTTILNSIAGITFPDKGEIIYKGVNLLEDNTGLSEFGVLTTGCFLDYLNTYDNLSLLMKSSGVKNTDVIKSKIDEALSLVGLEHQKKKSVKSFSFGMKQRLALAQTLLTPNKLLLWDEPFVGLDPLGREIMKKIIIQKAKKEQVGVLFSSHNLNDVAEICDRIVMIENGVKIYDDIFDSNKRYCIIISKSTPLTNLVKLKESTDAQVKIENHTIEFLDISLMEEIIRLLVENSITIVDLAIKENSISDFFMKGNNYE